MPKLALAKKTQRGYSSSANKWVPDDIVQQFVDEQVDLGPQIISLPVPPQRHAILVDVRDDKIMVCDWNGREALDWYKEYPEYLTYHTLLSKIQEKYPHRPIRYFKIDKTLCRKATQYSQLNKGGGCANYVFAWYPKHPDYKDYT